MCILLPHVCARVPACNLQAQQRSPPPCCATQRLAAGMAAAPAPRAPVAAGLGSIGGGSALRAALHGGGGVFVASGLGWSFAGSRDYAPASMPAPPTQGGLPVQLQPCPHLGRGRLAARMCCHQRCATLGGAISAPPAHPPQSSLNRPRPPSCSSRKQKQSRRQLQSGRVCRRRCAPPLARMPARRALQPLAHHHRIQQRRRRRHSAHRLTLLLPAAALMATAGLKLCPRPQVALKACTVRCRTQRLPPQMPMLMSCLRRSSCC
jgi:hypothetical protein